MKIKKLKIKLNKDNEYSDYRYFMPKSNNIKMTDGRDVDEAVQSLKDKIANLKEQANYLINKAPLVKYAEGASITAIKCADEKVRKFTIEGSSWQETRTGYNYIDSFKFTEKTVNGLKTLKRADGSIYFSGTSTAMTNFWFNDLNQKLKAGTYTFITNIDLTSRGRYTLIDSTSGTNVTIMNGTKTATFTLTEDITLSLILIQINENVTLKDNFYLMLVEGTEQKAYEKYGTSPSIFFPSLIQNVGSNINLFNIDTITTNHYIYADSGKINASNVSATSDYIAVKANQIYTLSYDYIKLNNKNNRAICFFNKDKTYISGITYTVTDKRIEILPQQDGYIRFAYDNGCINIKLVEGNFVGAYSPFLCSCINTTTHNENLFNIHTLPVDVFEIIADNEFRAYKSPINNYYWYNNISYTGKVCFQWKYKAYNSENARGLYLRIYKTDGTYVDLSSYLNKNGEDYIIVDNVNYAAMSFGSEYKNIIYDFKITLSEIPTIYTPYHSQQLIFPLVQGQKMYQGSVLTSDGIKHKRSQIILTGKEELWLNSANDFAMSGENYKTLDNGGKCLSSHYPYSTGGEYENYIRVGNAVFIMIKDTRFATVEEFKTFLEEQYINGTPVIIEYDLNEETLESYTEEQATAYNNLNEIYLYKKITFFTTDTFENKNNKANIKLIYKQDINAILEEEGV